MAIMGDGFVHPSARATHFHVIGKPGVGKSRTLESWFMQDVVSGQGVGVIDPHGDLFDHLLSRIARLADEQPSLAERVVIINPIDPTWTVCFNPFQAIEGFSRERLASFLTDVVIKIWNIDPADAPRMIRLLAFTFLALADLGLNLTDVPRFLLDANWRDDMLSHVLHPEVISYFRFEFPESAGAKHQWVTPVLNKVGALLMDQDLRLMFSGRSTINFRHIIDQRLILLVNLSKGLLGEANSSLLGAFIVAHLQKAALSRADQRERRPFWLYLDEFQNYTTDNVIDILSESRKYALSLVLAHQYLDQLSPDFQAAVMNTTGTLVCFRVGYQDASLLSRELFPPQSLENSHWNVGFLRLGRVPIIMPLRQSDPLTHEEMTTLLTHLDEREFWAKHGGPHPAHKYRSLDMPAPAMTDRLYALREQLVRTSGQRYGILKSDLRKASGDERGIITYALPEPTTIFDYEQVEASKIQEGETPATLDSDATGQGDYPPSLPSPRSDSGAD